MIHRPGQLRHRRAGIEQIVLGLVELALRAGLAMADSQFARGKCYSTKLRGFTIPCAACETKKTSCAASIDTRASDHGAGEIENIGL